MGTHDFFKLNYSVRIIVSSSLKCYCLKLSFYMAVTAHKCLTLLFIQQTGFDFKTIRWCVQHANNVGFKELPQTPIHSEASLSENQYIRSSTIIYNLTGVDTFTQFLCESGDTGMCGTGSAIQHVNISIGKPRMLALLYLCKSQNFIL